MKKAIAAIGACLCLSPFAYVQSAVATDTRRSDDAKRELELRVPDIVTALGLTNGKRAADIGAGDGFYEMALSRAVGPEGRIYAEDIDKGAIQRLRKRVSIHRLRNVEAISGAPDDPRLPASALDSVLMVIAYHEVADHQKMLEHVSAALKPGGRFVIVDMMPHKTLTRPREDQTKNHVIAAELVEHEVQQAGFEVVTRDDHFIDKPDQESTRWMIVFRKP